MVVCVAGAAWLALNYFIPAPPSKITIATGQTNQTYDAIGNKYREILARSGIKVEVRQTNGGIENIQLLNDRKSGIDVAFSQGGVDNAAQSPDRDYQEFCAGGRLSHPAEPVAEGDGELRFRLEPFTRRPFPVGHRMIENEV